MEQAESAKSASQTVNCDQAIFTSVRGPMGEGYRMIAASKGLKPEEKQIITRFSPSHDALCRNGYTSERTNVANSPRHNRTSTARSPASAVAATARVYRPSDAAIRGAQPETSDGLECQNPGTSPSALSFYALPTGRLCVAYSCYAGAEHTGRGGQRVYTIVVAMGSDAFARFGFSPFRIARAMERAGLTEPQLKPNGVLPELELEIPPQHTISAHDVTIRHHHAPILAALLANENVVVNVGGGWKECAEALMLSIPGPMRAAVAFSAGLRFSTGRAHRLQLLADCDKAARTRCAGQRIRYVDAECDSTTSKDAAREATDATPAPAWLTFVERHWRTGNLTALARRTSRPFDDVTPPALERVGRMYNTMDELPNVSSSDILAVAADHLQPTTSGIEDEIRFELVGCAQDELTRRFQAGPWSDIAPHWPNLVAMWRSSPDGTSFAEPLISKAIRRGLTESPLDAAEAALGIAGHPPTATDQIAHEVLLGEVVRTLADWVAAQRHGVPPDEPRPDGDRSARARSLSLRWRSVGPNSTAFRTALDHLDQVLATAQATT